jgi:hypothetical protein
VEAAATTAEVDTAPAAEPVHTADVEPDTDDTRTARQKILDHFEDSEGDQTVTQIMVGTGLNRNLTDSTLSRAVDAGLVERVGQGLYRRAPPKPPRALPPEFDPGKQLLDGRSFDDWMELVERWWADPSTWDIETLGPYPFSDGNLVPMNVFVAFKHRLEKRQAQVAEDVALLERLLEATGGNIVKSDELADIRPLKLMIASDISVERIVSVTETRYAAGGPPIVSWAELFQPVAEDHALHVLAPRLVERWKGRPTSADTGASPTVRRAMAKAAPQTLASASDTSTRGPEPPAAANAPEVSGARPAGRTNDVPTTAGLMTRFGKAPSPNGEPITRRTIATRFIRHEVGPIPRPASQPPRPPVQPPPPQRQALAGFTDEGWVEIIAGWLVGNVTWSRRRLGPAPGEQGCQVPQHVLKEYGLL